MAHQSKSGTTQFALDISPDAKLRFESLHQSMGLRTKAQTFEAILYLVSTKDKIDPAALERMEKKIDHSIHLLESLTWKTDRSLPTSPLPEAVSTWNILTKPPVGKFRFASEPIWISSSERENQQKIENF